MSRREFLVPASALYLSSVLIPSCADKEPPSAQVQQARHAVRGGSDGAAVVSSADTVVNRYAGLGQDARRGDRTLTLSTTAGLDIAALSPLAGGDMLLIIQPQGADIATDRDTIQFGAVTDYGDAGHFELVTVQSVDAAAGRIQLYGNCGGLRNNYSTAGHTQVIRVPQYASLTVQAGGSIVAPAWNGSTGGVVAIVVRDNAQVDGVIDASGRGFRGGQRIPNVGARSPGIGTFYASLSQADGGAKGEGVAGFTSEYASIGTFARGAPANGGGGGNRLVSGGGGGGNGGMLGAWNGQGVMATAVVGGAAAWPLDPSYDSTRQSFAGGGRGGYTASGAALDPTAVAPGTLTWLQDYRRERGGLGGRPVPNDPQSRLFFGGGGGAGDDFQSYSGSGAAGGGLVLLATGQLTGSGRIAANGGDGAPATATAGAGGGGGAGGTLVIGASSLSGVSLEARGGRGGSQTATGTQAAGPGGGGGGGYIAAPMDTQVSRLVAGGSGGTTASSDMTKFPRNGASDGAPGQADGVTSGELATTQACGGADLSVQLLPTPAQAQAREPVSLEIDVQNRGPSPAADVQVHLRVPAGTTLESKQPGNWDCTIMDQDLVCKRSLVMASETSSVVITLTPPFDTNNITLDADVSASTPDLDSSNNTVELMLPNQTPIIQKLDGGGLSCELTGGRSTPTSGAAGALALLLGALFATMARQRPRSSSR